MLPAFDNETGYLPAGIHPASWPEVESTLGFSKARQTLLVGLLAGCREFRKAGAKVMYLDGSFATKKRDPDDYDCCYHAAGINPDLLDPVLLQFEPDDRTPMQENYLGEFFPAEEPVETSIHIGTILTFFQQDHDGHARGIVAIDLATLP